MAQVTSANACQDAGGNYNFSAKGIETITKETLSMQVDCLGWNHKHNVLAVGGYELVKNDTTLRTGLLYLIIFDSSLPNGSSIIQEEPCSGILDLKWESTQQDRLIVATSNLIVMYNLNIDDAGLFNLERIYDYHLAGQSSLMSIYIEWMSPTQVIYSDSVGCINMLGIIEKKGESLGYVGLPGSSLHLALIEHVNLHEYVIWVVHFDSASQIIYTGADDGTFTAFHKINFTNREMHFVKRFPVGVTSINTKDDIVAIGCYDDILRIYTFNLPTGGPDSKVSLSHRSEINLGGAVWRTIWIPNLQPIDTNANQHDNSGVEETVYKIGVAAARNGIHMLTLKKPSWTWERNLSCLDYKGYLAYGIDVKKNVNENSYTVATCYFDNHLLHVWKMKPF